MLSCFPIPPRFTQVLHIYTVVLATIKTSFVTRIWKADHDVMHELIEYNV